MDIHEIKNMLEGMSARAKHPKACSVALLGGVFAVHCAGRVDTQSGIEKRVFISKNEPFVLKTTPAHHIGKKTPGEPAIYREALKNGLGGFFVPSVHPFTFGDRYCYFQPNTLLNARAMTGLTSESCEDDSCIYSGDCRWSDCYECRHGGEKNRGGTGKRGYSYTRNYKYCRETGAYRNATNYLRGMQIIRDNNLAMHLVGYYGEDLTHKLVNFLRRHNINDIHSGNFISMPSGEIKIFDYSGWDG